MKAVGIPKRHRRSSSLDAGLIELEYNHESIDVSELKRFQINGFRKPCVLMKSLTGGKHVITLSNLNPHAIMYIIFHELILMPPSRVNVPGIPSSETLYFILTMPRLLRITFRYQSVLR